MNIEDYLTQDKIEHFKNIKCESENIDYKLCYHFKKEKDKLEVIKDIVSFANTYGGYIIYGVKDKTFEWVGLDSESDDINDIQIRDYLKKFINQPVNFVANQFTIDGNVFFAIYIHKCENLIQFTQDGKYNQAKKNGTEEQKYVFHANVSYGRVGSSNQPITDIEKYLKQRNLGYRMRTNLSEIESPYKQFIERKDIYDDFLQIFNQEKSEIIQLKGLGGIGKTSFVYSFCEKLLRGNIEGYNNHFQYLIWITGKMTLFDPSGAINNLKHEELTFEEFLAPFTALFKLDVKKEIKLLYKEIIEKLKIFNTLIVIDNMETINDPQINRFLIDSPKNTKIIITSRINLQNITSPVLNISGMKHDEFTAYFTQQLKFYGEEENNIQHYLNNAENMNKLETFTYGSPIIINMITYQLAHGKTMQSIIDLFKNQGEEKLKVYDIVMDFCFNEIFKELNYIEQSILYILSIPQKNDDRFSIEDLLQILQKVLLEYCTKALIQDGISKLVEISFVIKLNDEFYSPPLVKNFANQKLSNSKKISVKEIEFQYNNFLLHKKNVDLKEQTFFDNVKAFSSNDRIIALEMRNVLSEFRMTDDYDTCYKRLDSLSKRAPSFARLYFEKAQVLIEANGYDDEIRDNFNLCTEKDPQNDFYWTKYGQYELSNRNKKSNKDRAKKFFTNAITINPKNYYAQHGLAMVLSREIQGSNNKDAINKVINTFEKGFSPNFTNKNHDVVNAHAYATFLSRIKMYKEAESICSYVIDNTKGFNKQLIALQGNIEKNLDPSFVGKKTIERYKQGIFANVGDDVIKKLINIMQGNK